MSARDLFKTTLRERRRFARGTPDHEYLTRTARKYLWLLRGVPANEWNTT